MSSCSGWYARLAGYREAQALLVVEGDILAHVALPESFRRRMHSANPFEWLSAELKRRSKVVGVYPNSASAERLLGAVPMEQDGEWRAAGQCYMALERLPPESEQRIERTEVAE